MRFLRWRMTSFYFNSRPSARGDYIDWLVEFCVINISIHAPPRGATGETAEMPRTIKISIHAPPRGATSSATVLASGVLFQFTPLREGRHSPRIRGNGFRLISIHAPPRGATSRHRRRSAWACISIHAPPRGATTLRNQLPGSPFYFNSRPSARGDKHSEPKLQQTAYFNSRPSARGDTVTVTDSRGRTAFQFTPLREGRLDCFRGAGDFRRISIHAPPRGATAGHDPAERGKPYFNSRPSARGDGNGECPEADECISIHAPPRGATGSAQIKDAAIEFQFTPLREGRLLYFARRCTYEQFQFTPLREGRQKDHMIYKKQDIISIHAPPRGATTQCPDTRSRG